MKVVIIIANYYPFIGGAEVFAQRFAEHLVMGENEVDVITGRWDRGLTSFEVINGVSIYRVRTIGNKHLRQIILSIPLLLKVLKLDRAKNYDMIHSVGESVANHVGTAIRKLRKKPHVITIQGGPLLTGFKSNPVDMMLKRLDKWSFRNADLIHVISHKLAIETERLGAHNVVVIPNGVDMAAFRPMDGEGLRKKYGLPFEKNIVISVARLVSVKGLDCLIRATALVLRDIPNVHLVLIGKGTGRCELEKLVSELGLDNNVQFLGELQHTEIPYYLSVADVFALPSLREGLGIAFLEAMACGIPVVGSSVGGIPDIIEDGKNGFLVPPGNYEKLAKTIKLLLENNGIRDKFIKQGLETIEQRFQWDSVLRRIDDAYQHI